MATREQIYKASILINSEQAENKIGTLKKQIADVKAMGEKAFAQGKLDIWKAANKEAESLTKKLQKQEKLAHGFSETIKNLSTAKEKELRELIKQINKELNSPLIKKGSEEWKTYVAVLKEAKKQLHEFTVATQEHQSAGRKLFKFLNDSWGGLSIMFQSITGISQTIRKSVQDYADIQEEMADVRKYTGLADEVVRELNEDFKEMDTRTPREQLNQLAGVAGRLGIQSKKEVLEFVKAADMIGVALGDDLGDDAVDKIGKLAMAFGEDERMGLQKAMLSTGSALNELAQNSSAQAGYLVEYTARVAGFGRQLGLTQAQIMGYGAVMDENMLKDEMAATAFGNMLTKMQTDTETFAKIAGKSVEEFTKLMREDANSAILAVADSLKRQDPTTMMKMLDSIGLDGSRAVGVLSTLADKIDDVRKHQQRATEAYEAGTSVQGEFNTMNNTVQARLDKCKKAFREMSIELGEKLLPVVKYTISTAGFLVRVLKVIVTFIYKYKSEVMALSAAIAAYVTVAKLQAHWTAIVNSSFITAFKSTKNFMSATQKLGEALTNFVGKLSFLRIAIAGVVGVLAGLLAKLVLFKDETNGLAKTVQGLNDAENTFSETLKESRLSIEEDEKKLRTLINANEDATETVRELAGKYPQLVREQMTAVEAYNALVKGSRAYCEQMALEKKAVSLDETIKDNEASLHVLERQLENATRELKKQQEASFSFINIQGQISMMAEANKERYLQEGYVAEDLADKVAMLTARVEKLRYDNQQLGEAMSATNKEMEAQAKKAQYWAESTDLMAVIYRKIGSAAETATEKIRGLRKTFADFLLSLVPKKETEEQAGPALDTKEYWQQQLKVRQDDLKRLREDASSTAEDVEAAAKAVKEAESKLGIFMQDKGNHSGEDPLKNQEKGLKESLQRQQIETLLSYRQGEIAYQQYLDKLDELQKKSFTERRKIYEDAHATERQDYWQLLKEESDYLDKQIEDGRKKRDSELLRDKAVREASVRAQYNDIASYIYQNEDALNEALFRNEREFLQKRIENSKAGTQERILLEQQLADLDEKHRMELAESYEKKLKQMRSSYAKMSAKEQMDAELEGLKVLYESKMNQGRISEEQYQKMIQQIREKYAKNIKEEQDERIHKGDKQQSKGASIADGVFNVLTIADNYKLEMEAIDQMLADHTINEQEAADKRRQIWGESMEAIAAAASTAFQGINQMMSAASSYAQACSDLEVARITANYDRQIEAAGKNSHQREKLEKQRDEAIAKAKTKANKKAMAMEMAQAIAQTAMGAISAYSSTMAGAPYPANLVLAPISAGIALAAGALQIATIKKQHEAEAAGYYEGGFTGGSRYRKEAGVVHEGEFVANHQAVNNRQLMPVFNLIDQAQRSNRVASLRAEDVTNVMGGPAAQVVTPIVNVQAPDNKELLDTLEMVRDTQDRLATQIEQGIGVDVPIDGENGIYRRMRRYESLLNNK